jgi:DNA polymerase-3 subunit delta
VPLADGFRTVRAAVDARVFAPVYYLLGDDSYLKEQAVRELLDAALDPSVRDFNCEWCDAGALDAETLGRLLGTPPMLADRRAVVVRDVHALRKPARAELERYLARPAPDTLLLLVATDGQPDATLARLGVACGFAPLPPERLRRWITHHATTVLGVSLTDDAVALLAQSVGNDLQQLAAELDKCASFARGAVGAGAAPAATTADGVVVPVPEAPIPVVTDATVSAIVGVRRGETSTDLLEAVARRDTMRAVGLVPFVLAQPKVTAVQLVMALSTQLLALTWGRARRDAGVPGDRLWDEYMGYLKQTKGAMVGRPWGEAARVWSQAVERWTADDLRRALRLTLEADLALKDTRVSREEQVMLSLVLALAARPRATRGRAA